MINIRAVSYPDDRGAGVEIYHNETMVAFIQSATLENAKIAADSMSELLVCTNIGNPPDGEEM
jgi:hypothetical protein